MHFRQPSTQEKIDWLIGMGCVVVIVYYAWNGNHWATGIIGYLLAMCLTSAIWLRFR